MSSHVPGRRLVEGPRVRDRQAIERAGCSTSTDHDHGELYEGEAVLFPVESRQTYGGKPVVGICGACRSAIVVADFHGNGKPACVLCGTYAKEAR